MKINLNDLYPILIHKFEDESSLLKSLKKLHANFTNDRIKIADYRSSPEMISAYTLFYLPTNVIKFKWMMYFLQSTIKNIAKLKIDFSNYDFIDLGTGPGTYVLAYLDYFFNQSNDLGNDLVINNKIFALDISPLMLSQAQKCIEHFFPNFKHNLHYGLWSAKELKNIIESNHTEDKDKSKGEDQTKRRNCWLSIGHALDEIGHVLINDYIDKIEPAIVSFLTPGTSDSFKELMIMKVKMQQKGYNLIYPCLSCNFIGPNFICPIEEKNNNINNNSNEEVDWCHQVVKGDYSNEVARLAQLASIDRRYLPFIAHVYIKKEYVNWYNEGIKNEIKCARVIRFLSESKADFQYNICLLPFDKSRGNKIIRVQLLKRDIAKEDLKRVRNLSLGETLFFEIKKVISDDFYRIIIKETEMKNNE